MPLKGLFYDGQTAESHDLQLELDDQGIISAYPPLIPPVAFKEITLSRRIGNIARTLTFPSGGVFETTDHETLDSWLNKHQVNHGLVHKLESSTQYAIGALVFMLAFIAWTYFYGIPWFSKQAAYALPAEASVYIGQGAMETMDDRFFSESELDVERRHSLTEQFTQLLPNTENDGEIKYELLFRKGGYIGANAFALPDGTVVITDELIKLAKHDEEILSILLHEIGHVEHRHSLRRVISHSGLAILTVLITGDVSSAGELVLALPNILMDSSYSRNHEWEADGYALRKMQKNGIRTSRFADIMERLGSYQGEFENTPDTEDESIADEECENENALDSDWLEYMSSHPASKERIARFRAAEKINSE
jgi:Zn-dependent protease with chaperone function